MPDTMPIKEQLHGFIDDLEVSLDFFIKNIDCDNIILYGMGGSAISNDIVLDFSSTHTVKPITVIKSPVLPSWANERTLTIISSYSGNTAEIIDAYKNAVARNCIRIVISSGGTLRNLTKKNNDMYIPLSPRMHPRHSIGFMIGYIVSIIRATGCENFSNDILDATPRLKEYRETIENDNPLIKELSEYFFERIPVICSYNEMNSIIFRWKTQLNENSKMVAFYTSFSDFIRFDAESWAGKQDGLFALTLLAYDKEDVKRNEDLGKLISFLDDHKIRYKLVTIGGSTYAENMLRTLILGDYLSIRLAEMNKVNSSEVPPINTMKEKLKAKLASKK